jgi:hypothetical protein
LSLGKVRRYTQIQSEKKKSHTSMPLGRVCYYLQEYDGTDFMFPGMGGHVDLEVAQAWKMFGADLQKEVIE